MLLNQRDYVENSTFNAACAERTRYPLFQGKYKIDEFHHRTKQFLETLEKIDALRRAKGESLSEVIPLGCCISTIEDQTNWLQALPQELSELHAYKLVAGINALHGDGLTQNQITKLIQRHRPVIDSIVSELQRVSLDFKHIDNARVNVFQVKALKKLVEQSIYVVHEVLKEFERLIKQ